MNLLIPIYHVSYDLENRILIQRDHGRRYCILAAIDYPIKWSFEYPSDDEFKQVLKIHKQTLIVMIKQHLEYCPITQFRFYTFGRKKGYFYRLLNASCPSQQDCELYFQIDEKRHVIETIKQHRFQLKRQWNEPKVVKRNHRRVMKELKMTPNGMQVQIDKYGFNRVMKKYGY